MDNVNRLNTELLNQPFTEEGKPREQLDECRHIASVYARIENAIAVLSDMKTDMSYIYYGGIAERLGLAKQDKAQTIHSIWEEDIIGRIHPDDLPGKYSEELRFYYYMKSIPAKKRTDYYLQRNIRMRDVSGNYVYILHRMFYLAYDSNGCARLSLCLYSLSPTALPECLIVNSLTGLTIKQESQDCSHLLSSREKAVLRLIDEGKMSKDIAQIMTISIYTVSRHRQNILKKLQVNNSMEACRLAKNFKLL